jgi:hypothetical protein
MKSTFLTLFSRDLNRLYKDIEAYPNDAILWQKVDGITNPAGNLCLHLIGNLNEYIGRQIGHIPYERNRPYEFSAADIPKATLLDMITKTKIVVEKAIKGITVKQFKEKYPENVLGYDMTVHFFLVHLNGHLNYHLGQINYHRRILTAGESIKFVI